MCGYTSAPCSCKPTFRCDAVSRLAYAVIITAPKLCLSLCLQVLDVIMNVNMKDPPNIVTARVSLIMCTSAMARMAVQTTSAQSVVWTAMRATALVAHEANELAQHARCYDVGRILHVNIHEDI